jgi:hypothetical protein
MLSRGFFSFCRKERSVSVSSDSEAVRQAHAGQNEWTIDCSLRPYEGLSKYSNSIVVYIPCVLD